MGPEAVMDRTMISTSGVLSRCSHKTITIYTGEGLACCNYVLSSAMSASLDLLMKHSNEDLKVAKLFKNCSGAKWFSANNTKEL